LSELLLEKGYNVHGLVRRTSTSSTSRIDHIKDRLTFHDGDMTDSGSLVNVLKSVQPDEVYNLAAQSHVRTSFENPEYTANTDALGTLRLLEASRMCGSNPRFYQASTSELYGIAEVPQNEQTPFYPRSPYGIAKLFAYWTVVNYRESGMFACNGILFNHESPRRGDDFVTKKIVRELVKIKTAGHGTFALGNLDAKRDWGYAKEYVNAMWRMLQIDKPEDFVIATGESHTVRDFLNEAAAYLDMEWEPHVTIDPRYFRPTEVDYLLGDASKAKKILGWTPQTTFKDLVRIMVDSERRWDWQ
jgi:GDPmannose 4,6-dehydratase